MDNPKISICFSGNFLKAQSSSVISTSADFLLTVLLTQIMGLWYIISSGLGTLIGGIINFSLGRNWVFRSATKGLYAQVFSYATVWMASMLLNTIGVYSLAEFLNFSYIISKSITAVLVGVFFNYYFQKSLVFKT